MIFFVGDIHGEIDISKLNTKNFPIQKKLTKNDYIIICGDFGCIWDGSKSDQYWLKWLENKNFTTLFIDGNHENFDLLYSYPREEKFSGIVTKISNSIYHLRRGEVYSIDNKNIFTFGGAKSSDIEYRKEGISWWPEEVPNKYEMDYGLTNLQKCDYNVDIVISHTCPASTFKKLETGNKKITELENYLEKVKNLLDINHPEYKWYFGHFHLDEIIEKKLHCLYKKMICPNKSLQKLS